jgi:hypothetical protein
MVYGTYLSRVECFSALVTQEALTFLLQHLQNTLQSFRKFLRRPSCVQIQRCFVTSTFQRAVSTLCRSSGSDGSCDFAAFARFFECFGGVAADVAGELELDEADEPDEERARGL